MHVVLLGTAAGGGFPQWNCWCSPCRAARESPARARPRTQSSIAISADGERWFLCNASPDVREQLALIAGGAPPGVRHVPIEGVVLTDAELDHSLGVVLLREAGRLSLHATAATMQTLERDTRILPTTRAFTDVALTTLPLEACVPLLLRDGTPSGLRVQAFDAAGDPPRFASAAAPGHTVGLLVLDERTGGTLAYLPGCARLDDALLARLRRADAVLFDGTFWSDDELIALGIGARTATQIGHVPIDGPGGSLLALAALPSRDRVYTHINNTNPVLFEDSPERRAVAAAGVTVGHDGLRLTL